LISIEQLAPGTNILNPKIQYKHTPGDKVTTVTEQGIWSEKPICEIGSRPDLLNSEERILDDGDNVVLLNELTSLKSGDIKIFGTRGKNIRDILINASKSQNEAPPPSEEYTQCLTASIPSP
jgi:hypothetical protein